MTRLALCLMVALAGCGDDETTHPPADAPVPPIDAPVNPPPDADPGAPDVAVLPPDSAPADAPPSMGMAPVINSVSWTTPAGCTVAVASNYTITIDVTDADTPSSALTYSGTVAGCSGMVDMNPDTLSCPNFAPYTGTITVSDPQGNEDSQSITIMPCMNGSAP